MLGVLITVALAACAEHDKELKVADVLPAKYSEAAIPETLRDFMKGFRIGHGFWSRCIDCDLDWEGLIGHMESNPAMAGYRDSTDDWLDVWGRGNVPEDVLPQLIKTYSSPHGTFHVMVFNLKLIRDRGTIVGTGGDFMILAGPDRIEHYRK